MFLVVGDVCLVMVWVSSRFDSAQLRERVHDVVLMSPEG